MSDIRFLLKFGEREYMERFACGNLYFSNAITFRYYEEQLRIKGQGDRLEGGSMMHTHNLTIKDNVSGETVKSGVSGSFPVHYDPANLIPVFCMFCCFDKDCSINTNGSQSISLSDDIKQNIITHFPKADTVAIVDNPYEFIDAVRGSFDTECKSDIVNYFHVYGIEGKGGTALDKRYMEYLTQDTPKEKVEGGTAYSFNARYVYRSLLCKDVFFNKEQEYRFLLPDIELDEPKEFSVKLCERIELQDLDSFFGNK